MSHSYFRPERPPMRRSTQVALLLLGSAGVIGVGMILQAWREDERAQRDAAARAQEPLPEPVREDQSYANNTYLPGVGYYHAPFFNWFPIAWNYNDPARGYYAGGRWHAQPQDLPVTASRPSPSAVAGANAQIRSLAASRAAAHNSSSSIFRGGFGSSSRSGVS